MLDALIDGQDRDVAGAAEASGVEQLLQRRQHPGRPVGRREDAVHKIRAGQVQRVFGDSPALMLQQRRLVSEDRLNSLNTGICACGLSCWSHVYTSETEILPSRRVRTTPDGK